VNDGHQGEPPPEPTIFHITHWKAGSQWVRGVLTEAQPWRVVPPIADQSHFSGLELVPGAIYTPLYVDKDTFRGVVGPEAFGAGEQGGGPHRAFVVVRDLRDTLISWYFSLRYSHDEARQHGILGDRRRLNDLSIEDGLKFRIAERYLDFATIQMTWLGGQGGAGVPMYRYEDMLRDEQGVFAAIFAYCGFDTPDEQRRDIVWRYRFEHVSGRARGQEDKAAHERKGIAGDWRNHFTPDVKELFKQRYGEVLIRTGYEPGYEW
jgi:hypothetical protein